MLRTRKSYRSRGDSMGVAAPVGRGVGCAVRGAKVASSMLGTTVCHVNSSFSSSSHFISHPLSSYPCSTPNLISTSNLVT